jgi:DNA repair exonuclease SbcCD ATPase subunit
VKLEGEALGKLHKIWKNAEARAKRTEVVQTEVCVPVINELRYAGYHLLSALSAATEDETAQELDKCKRHCERGYYDAIEAEVLVYLEYFKVFQEDYRLIPIEIPGLDYLGVCGRARETQDAISEARKDNESRGDFYGRLDGLCDDLNKNVRRLEDARLELNKRLAEHQATAERLQKAEEKYQEEKSLRLAAEKRAKSAHNRFWLPIGITAIGVVLAAVHYLGLFDKIKGSGIAAGAEAAASSATSATSPEASARP